MKRLIRGSALLGGASVIAYAVAPEANRDFFVHAAVGLKRFAVAGFYGAITVYDYKMLPNDGTKESTTTTTNDSASSSSASSSSSTTSATTKSAEYVAARKIVDKRAADRLLKVAMLQGGLYTKLGQYLSTLTHVLPPEFTTTLSVLQDKARSAPWSSVKHVFETDLQVKAEDVFSYISEEPIASASLAQVHRGILKSTGEEVAVKIQYPDLKWIAKSDISSLHFFFLGIETLFPAYGYMWLFPEFRASVNNELNFLQEARNAQRVAAMFRHDPRVHIPVVYQHLTAPRVMVMEFIHGVKPTNTEALKAIGVVPEELAATISRFFGEQVHVHGFVHCDPHPGNLLVRKSPKDGKGQLVVLDHGMYRRLTPKFRAGYCKLWQALLMRNHTVGLEACRDLGVSDSAYDVLSLMLLQRGASSSSGLGAKMSKKEINELKEKYKDKATAEDINKFMQELPRDLLFVSRNTNMVRGLNLALGGTARGRFRITGQCAIKGLILTDANQSHQFLTSASAATMVGSSNSAKNHEGDKGSGRRKGLYEEDSSSSSSSSLVSDVPESLPLGDAVSSNHLELSGQILNYLTESELQDLLLQRGEKARQTSGSSSRGWWLWGVVVGGGSSRSSSTSQSLSRRLNVAYNVAVLEYTLWVFDVMWPVIETIVRKWGGGNGGGGDIDGDGVQLARG